MSTPLEHGIAMVTAWMTASKELMGIAVPPAPTIDRLRAYKSRPNETLHGIVADYDAMSSVAVELALVCATALTLWAESQGLSPIDVLQDIAASQSQHADAD